MTGRANSIPLRAVLLAGMAMTLGNTPPDMSAKPASPATIAAQRAVAATLPTGDGRDSEFAAQGFLSTRSDPVIKAADGHTVWNLDAYKFVEGTAPSTVNPSLWRHMGLLRRSGLFAVTEGVWQVYRKSDLLVHVFPVANL